MVNTSKWPVTVDGVRLDTLAYNVSTRTGRDIAPGLAGSNVSTEMRDGELWVPHKKAGPGTFVLKMWVAGTDEDGVVPVGNDDYWKYRQNLDMLLRMFHVTHRRLDVRQQWDVAGTKVRQAMCEVGTIITPEMLAAFPYTSEMTVELRIPDAFWQDVADSNYDSQVLIPGGILANTDLPLPGFAAGTAPMRDLYVVVDGPITNPKVIDYRSAHYVQLNAAVPGGQQWVVNTAEWTSKVGSGIAFTQNGVDMYASTVFAGSHSPKMFGITQDPLGPQARIEGTGFGAATRLRIRGKIKYL